VAVVLSTETVMPRACAASTIAAMSQMSSCGFVGVSTHTSLAPSSASSCALPRVGTSRTSIASRSNQPATRRRIV
jgi:hypothetical protein